MNPQNDEAPDVTTMELVKWIKKHSKKPNRTRLKEWMISRAERILLNRVLRAKAEFGL